MGKLIQFPADRQAGFLWAVNGHRRLESWRLKSANGQVIDLIAPKIKWGQDYTQAERDDFLKRLAGDFGL